MRDFYHVALRGATRERTTRYCNRDGWIVLKRAVRRCFSFLYNTLNCSYSCHSKSYDFTRSYLITLVVMNI
jgi:hypothetical protein